MKTDSLFYRIFQTLPEIFFTLTGFEYNAADYQFQAVELKQTAFRLDGVFKPVAVDTNLPTIFVEVQFQPDDKFYSRFFSEIFLYLHQYPQTNPCKAVVIYPERKTETDNIHRYGDLINVANINRIYLQELLNQTHANWRLGLLELIVADTRTAPSLAKTLVLQTQNQSALLDLIETILTYKFPHLDREEVRKMLHIPDINLDIRTTQFYKDVFAEGKEEGKLEGKLETKREVVLSLLQHRFSDLNNVLLEKITHLDLNQLDKLLEKIFEFQQVDDLSNWLKQLNH